MNKTKDGRKTLRSDSPAWITVPKKELVSWVSTSFVFFANMS